MQETPLSKSLTIFVTSKMGLELEGIGGFNKLLVMNVWKKAKRKPG